MQGKLFRGGLFLLPLVVLVTSCASYKVGAGDVVAHVYVQTSQDGRGLYGAVGPVLVFDARADGRLTQMQAANIYDPLVIGQGGMIFILSQTIQQYAIGQDGSLSGPVSALDPTQFDATACGPPTGQAVLDPTGTYLSVELINVDCDVWQTYRLRGDGTYQFLGEDDSGWSNGVSMGTPSENVMSTDGQYAYGLAGGVVQMKRDASGVLRTNRSFKSPWDTQERYQPGVMVTDGNNHVAILMFRRTDANPWVMETWLASFSIDPGTGNLTAISTYDNMPKTAGSAPYDGSSWPAAAFSPQGDIVAVGGYGEPLQTFQFHEDGPATPVATAALPQGQFITQLGWDRSNHLYVLAQTAPQPPDLAQFYLYVFTASNGQLTPAPGSPWNVSNGIELLVVPKG